MSVKHKVFNFEDHFSKQSGLYAQYRPQYPDEIYTYLASITPGHSLALDCGTGNGQAAMGLARYFDKVHATDASAEQIALAYAHDKVDYRVEPAERVSLSASSTDLVAVAVAIHWFNFDEFYREVKRVLKPGGIIAAWTYSLTEISPEIDQLIQHLSNEILGGFWPERISYIEQGYQSLPFPFEEITPPSFVMEVNWDLVQLAGYLNSWSATQRYKAQNENHPLELIWHKLVAAWGDENKTRTIRWPLHFRIGRHVPETIPSTNGSVLLDNRE
ncbi:MAG: class I SAM-dependent methyltransferase [Anaerolineales bacterium]